MLYSFNWQYPQTEKPKKDGEAPIPMPIDSNLYIWDEPTQSWIEVTNV